MLVLLMLQVAAPTGQTQAPAVRPELVVEGRGSPTATIPRVENAEVRIDGRLDEPVWAQATRLTGFWQYQPVDGRPAEEETEVLVWYAPDAIHFGIIARDRGRPRQHRQRRPHRPRHRHLPRPAAGVLLRGEPARLAERRRA